MALLESYFENRLSLVGENRFFFFIMELHRELSYRQPNGSLMRAILALFFFSVYSSKFVKSVADPIKIPGQN